MEMHNLTYRAVEDRFSNRSTADQRKVLYVEDVFETPRLYGRVMNVAESIWQTRPDEGFAADKLESAYEALQATGLNDRHFVKLARAEINPFGTQEFDKSDLYRTATVSRLGRTIGIRVLDFTIKPQPDVSQVFTGLLTPELRQRARIAQKDPFKLLSQELSALGNAALTTARHTNNSDLKTLEIRLQRILAVNVPVETERRVAVLALSEPNPVTIHKLIDQNQTHKVVEMLTLLRGVRSIARGIRQLSRKANKNN